MNTIEDVLKLRKRIEEDFSLKSVNSSNLDSNYSAGLILFTAAQKDQISKRVGISLSDVSDFALIQAEGKLDVRNASINETIFAFKSQAFIVTQGFYMFNDYLLTEPYRREVNNLPFKGFLGQKNFSYFVEDIDEFSRHY